MTTEANPESTDPRLLDELRAAGFTRLSLGLQSTSPAVLRVLDRTHTPGRALDVVGWARAAGFEHVNLDLIYGTPGETDAEFVASLPRRRDQRRRPHLRLLADRRAGYPAGPAGPHRRAADDRRRRAGRSLPAGRGGADRRRAALVRGVQLGRDRRPPGAGTTWRTGPAATGGGSGRARIRTSAGCGGGTSSTRRPTRPRSPRADRRATRARCWIPRSAGWRTSCCRLRLVAGLPRRAAQRRRSHPRRHCGGSGTARSGPTGRGSGGADGDRQVVGGRAGAAAGRVGRDAPGELPLSGGHHRRTAGGWSDPREPIAAGGRAARVAATARWRRWSGPG